MLNGKNKTQKDVLPFVTQYRPSVSNLKQALLTKCHLISYKKGKSLRDLLVRAKL